MWYEREWSLWRGGCRMKYISGDPPRNWAWGIAGYQWALLVRVRGPALWCLCKEWQVVENVGRGLTNGDQECWVRNVGIISLEIGPSVEEFWQRQTQFISAYSDFLSLPPQSMLSTAPGQSRTRSCRPLTVLFLSPAHCTPHLLCTVYSPRWQSS